MRPKSAKSTFPPSAPTTTSTPSSSRVSPPPARYCSTTASAQNPRTSPSPNTASSPARCKCPSTARGSSSNCIPRHVGTTAYPLPPPMWSLALTPSLPKRSPIFAAPTPMSTPSLPSTSIGSNSLLPKALTVRCRSWSASCASCPNTIGKTVISARRLSNHPWVAAPTGSPSSKRAVRSPTSASTTTGAATCPCTRAGTTSTASATSIIATAPSRSKPSKPAATTTVRWPTQKNGLTTTRTTHPSPRAA